MSTAAFLMKTAADLLGQAALVLIRPLPPDAYSVFPGGKNAGPIRLRSLSWWVAGSDLVETAFFYWVAEVNLLGQPLFLLGRSPQPTGSGVFSIRKRP